MPLQQNSQAAPEWFIEQLPTLDDEGRRYTRVSIETGARRSRLQQVAVVNVREGEEPATVLAKVDRLARAHAEKVVRVSLLRSREQKPDDAMLWDLGDDDLYDEDDVGDENGDKAMKNATGGLLKQSYVHNERLLDRMLALHGATLSHVLEENGRLREERADVHAQHLAALEMIRSVEDEAAAVARGSRREEAIFGTLGTLVQAAAVRIAGKQGGDGPLSSALGQLFSTLTAEQTNAFLEKLTAEQLQLFMSIHSQVVPETTDETPSVAQETTSAETVVEVVDAPSQ